MHDRFDDARFYCMMIRSKAYANLRNSQEMARLKRHYREILRRVQSEDYLTQSLQDGMVRVCYEENGEYSTEYMILKGEYTPHDIHEIVDSHWMTVNSPYDCTGRPFTVDIHAKQTPVGLVFIHRMGLDV